MAREAQSRCLRNRKPHPCGYYADSKRECRCNDRQIQTYRNKISGPLLDRIDIHIEVPTIEYSQLTALGSGEPSVHVRDRVTQARRVQRTRFRNIEGLHCNAGMGAKHLQTHCKLVPEAQEMLRGAISELNFSARAYDRILKVSRTIADLAGCDEIQSDHIFEAIQYRTLDRQLWT